MVGIHFIEVRGFVRVADLKGQLSLENQVGETDIVLFLEIKDFVDEVIDSLYFNVLRKTSYLLKLNPK